MSACEMVVICAWMLAVRVMFPACGPEGFVTVPLPVSVHVVPESEPEYVAVPPVRVTVVDGTALASYGSDAACRRETA